MLKTAVRSLPEGSPPQGYLKVFTEVEEMESYKPVNNSDESRCLYCSYFDLIIRCNSEIKPLVIKFIKSTGENLQL